MPFERRANQNWQVPLTTTILPTKAGEIVEASGKTGCRMEMNQFVWTDYVNNNHAIKQGASSELLGVFYKEDGWNDDQPWVQVQLERNTSYVSETQHFFFLTTPFSTGFM